MTNIVVALVSGRPAWCWAMWRDVRWRHWQGGEKERQHLSTSGTRWRTESCLRLTVKLATHCIHTCRITSAPAAATQLHHSRRRYSCSHGFMSVVIYAWNKQSSKQNTIHRLSVIIHVTKIFILRPLCKVI